MRDFRYWVPTEVVFASGSLGSLAALCGGFGQKALIVTGKRSARAGGALDRACAQLPGAVVFDEVEENPTTTTCELGADRCRKEGCDFVVAVGGGSPMDVAKTVAVLARNPGTCQAYFGKDLFSRDPLPIVAVPTTAGTGSEVTPYAVLTDPEEATKRTIAGSGLFPRIAVLDPELSLTMPRSVTLSTGLDALSQAMEGMVSLKGTALGDVLALEAIRLVKRWLPRAVADGHDLDARTHMLFAAMLSGCVIAQSGTTLVHGMGYSLTVDFGVPHGLANGLLLAPVFQYNAKYVPNKVAAIAEALGFPAESTPENAAGKVVAALHALFAELGASPAAKDVGVPADRLEDCAEQVCANKDRFKNQVGSPSLEDVTRFYRDAFEGTTA